MTVSLDITYMRRWGFLDIDYYECFLGTVLHVKFDDITFAVMAGSYLSTGAALIYSVFQVQPDGSLLALGGKQILATGLSNFDFMVPNLAQTQPNNQADVWISGSAGSYRLRVILVGNSLTTLSLVSNVDPIPPQETFAIFAAARIFGNGKTYRPEHQPQNLWGIRATEVQVQGLVTDGDVFSPILDLPLINDVPPLPNGVMFRPSGLILTETLLSIAAFVHGEYDSNGSPQNGIAVGLVKRGIFKRALSYRSQDSRTHFVRPDALPILTRGSGGPVALVRRDTHV